MKEKLKAFYYYTRRKVFPFFCKQKLSSAFVFFIPLHVWKLINIPVDSLRKKNHMKYTKNHYWNTMYFYRNYRSIHWINNYNNLCWYKHLDKCSIQCPYHGLTLSSLHCTLNMTSLWHMNEIFSTEGNKRQDLYLHLRTQRDKIDTLDRQFCTLYIYIDNIECLKTELWNNS